MDLQTFAGWEGGQLIAPVAGLAAVGSVEPHLPVFLGSLDNGVASPDPGLVAPPGSSVLVVPALIVDDIEGLLPHVVLVGACAPVFLSRLVVDLVVLLVAGTEGLHPMPARIQLLPQLHPILPFGRMEDLGRGVRPLRVRIFLGKGHAAGDQQQRTFGLARNEQLLSAVGIHRRFVRFALVFKLHEQLHPDLL